MYGHLMNGGVRGDPGIAKSKYVEADLRGLVRSDPARYAGGRLGVFAVGCVGIRWAHG